MRWIALVGNGARIIAASITSVTIGPRRGVTMLREVTTFGNCRNHLQDVFRSILGLQAGRDLREPSVQFYMELIRRSANSVRPTSRRSLADLRTNRRRVGVRRVSGYGSRDCRSRPLCHRRPEWATSSPAGSRWARPIRSPGLGMPAGRTRLGRVQ